MAEILSGLGLLEVSNYHLAKKEDQFSKMGVSEKQEEGFIELEDEAVSTYYDFLRQAPTELRKTTNLQTPDIGILWAPTDESLFVTGKIPKPKLIPLPRYDPALILDIPDGKNNYKHVVAAWDIGAELPFRNWLAEYSEHGTKPNLRSLEGGKK